MSKHQDKIMTVRFLLKWQESSCPHQDADELPDLLEGSGVDPSDLSASIECSWPDHVITPRPNSDVSVRLVGGGS